MGVIEGRIYSRNAYTVEEPGIYTPAVNGLGFGIGNNYDDNGGGRDRIDAE